MDLKRSFHGYSIDSLRIRKTGSFQVDQNDSDDNPSSFKRILSQFVASSSINIILFDIGLALSYPTLVIPALLQSNLESNHISSHSSDIEYNITDIQNGSISIDDNHYHTINQSHGDPFYNLPFFKHYTMNDYQTSWYVSIMYICQPLGSIIGGSLVGYMGSKRLMQVLNIFMFTGWLLPFFSDGPAYLYMSNILLGIGIGCSEAPIATYLGEITQVSIRGFILTLAQVFLSISFLVPYLISLGISSWRWQALILSSIPVITFIICSVVPETPVWLISKQRYKEAENSLRWLRGWTTSDNVKDELEEITRYHMDTLKTMNSQSMIDENGHIHKQKSTEVLVLENDSLKEKIRYFFNPRMRRPFIIICTMFALLYLAGMCTIRPYLVILFQDMGIEMDPNNCALWVTFAGAVGNIVSLCIVKFTGKRFIVLSALLGSALCTLSVALIKMGWLGSSFSFISFVGLSCFSGYGIIPIPWMLQSELYPFRGRGFASGLAAAFSYLVGFAATKTYLEMVHLLTVQGVFLLFTVCSLYGLVFFWLKLPETEGKSFQEIDEFFNNRNNKGK